MEKKNKIIAGLCKIYFFHTSCVNAQNMWTNKQNKYERKSLSKQFVQESKTSFTCSMIQCSLSQCCDTPVEQALGVWASLSRSHCGYVCEKIFNFN